MVYTNMFAETYSYSFEKNVVTANGTINLGGMDWTIANSSTYFTWDSNGRGVQFGSSNAPATTLKLSTNGIHGNITNVTVNTSGAKGIDAKLNVTVGGIAFGEEYSLVKNATDASFNGNASGEIVLNYTNSSSKAIYIKSISVTYVPDASKNEAELEFNPKNVELTFGDAFTAPRLTKATTAEVTYASNNVEVATVNETTGEVTILAVGKATITATAAENDDYYGGNASYTITVKKPVLTEVTLPYEETFAEDEGSFVINNVDLGALTYVWKHDASNKYMKASAYASGKNNAAQSWLVSPTINMDGIAKATLTFTQCINKYFGNVAEEATLWVKDVTETEGEWIQKTITYPAIADGNNWSAFEEQDVKLNEFAGKKIKIGFKYVSTDEAAGTWEIKNISVTGVVTSIDAIASETENANAPMYNLAGQRVNNSYKGIVIKNGKKFFNNK